MNIIFSPILESSQPAFNYMDKYCKIHFNIPDQVNINNLRHIGIRVMEQKSGQSVVDIEQYPDGIIYSSFSASSTSSEKTYSLSSKLLKDKAWKKNTYYKIQMRFGTGALNKDVIEGNPQSNYNDFRDSKGHMSIDAYNTWKNAYLEAGYGFSEWSTIMLIKAIEVPTVRLLNEMSQDLQSLVIGSSYGTEYSTTPLFEAVFQTPSDEPITHYKFDLYDITNAEELIESSGWLVHNNSKDLWYSENKMIQENIDMVVTGGDSHRFKNALIYNVENPHIYRLTYSARTLNLYETSFYDYTFSVIETAITAIPRELLFKYNVNEEEALVNITLEPNYENYNDISFLQLSGLFVITRTSEKSNFKIWEDIQYLNWTSKKIFNKEIIFTDYTIESGVQYKYGIQKQSSSGVRTTRKEIGDGAVIELNFNYCYLYDNGIQLKLKYNNTVSSFKNTTLVTKQDTLGSKYPVLMRNGDANYREFPIGGLISMHADEAQQFFQLKLKEPHLGYYYKDELIIPARKFEQQSHRTHTKSASIQKALNIYTFDTNLTYDNMYIERKFREKVLDFLNDGRYKLFKSPTEGNIIIGLMNVQATPNQQLGRMIYSFTSTAYEVLDNTFENLVQYGIQELGDAILEDTTPEYICGQIHDLNIDTWENLNLKEPIQSIIEQMSGDTIEKDKFKYTLEGIETLQFEPFPNINLTEEINYLTSNINNYLGIKNPTLAETAEYENNLTMRSRMQSLLNRQRDGKANWMTQEITNEKGEKTTILIPPMIRISVSLDGGSSETILTLGMHQVYKLNNLIELYGDSKDQDNLIIKLLPNEITIDNQIVKYYPPVICNFVALGHIIENPQTTTKRITSALSWGQVDAIFTEKYQEFYIEQTTNNQLKNPPMNVYNTLDISSILEEQVKKQVAIAYGVAENYFDSYSETEGYYNFKEQNKYLKILGFEYLDIEADKNNKIILSRVSGKGEVYDSKTIVIGPTNRYKLKYISADEIQKIHLHEDNGAHCLINYQVQCYIEEKGVITQ